MTAIEEAGQMPLDLDLELAERRRRGFTGRDPAQEARKWRAANPDAWELLVDWATDDCRRGRHCSMKFYGERLRHTVSTNAVDDCPYRINNTAFSGLVRMLLAERPELEGAFETRTSRADLP